MTAECLSDIVIGEGALAEVLRTRRWSRHVVLLPHEHDPEIQQEIREWCFSQFGATGFVRLLDGEVGDLYLFSTDTAAVLFKMRWF